MIDSDITYSYPLVIAIEDCFIPEVAAPLLRGLYKLDDESAQVTVRLAAMEAQGELERRKN